MKYNSSSLRFSSYLSFKINTMKSLICILLTFIEITSAFAQNSNPNYDSTLAKNLGADDYGMKMYVFVVLKSGDNDTTDKKFINECFVGHLTNIHRLVDEKLLIVAGPFGKNSDDFRGLFILNVPTVEEANALLETDPAIKAHILKAETYPWYGSAALSEYLDTSDKIWKVKP